MPTPSVINQYQYTQSIPRAIWDQKYFFETFQTNPVMCSVLGTACTGTAGDHNVLYTGKNAFDWYVIGTQTILAPSLDTFGLNLVQDAGTAGDGMELCMGVTAISPAAFIIGTDAAFFITVEFKAEDVSGTNPLIVGFRKAQAFDATLANYTDFVSIGLVGTANPNTIYIQTQKTTAGVVATDTTQTVADGIVVRFSIKVSSAGVVTYLVNSAAPTATAAYTFTTGLTVVPFIRFTEAAHFTSYASCDYFELGFQS
jgi:hypothetical protein